jgi:hypothetical protein
MSTDLFGNILPQETAKPSGKSPAPKMSTAPCVFFSPGAVPAPSSVVAERGYRIVKESKTLTWIFYS